MTAARPRFAVLIACSLVGLALLPACGRRGALEPPPGSADRAKATAAEAQTQSTFAGSTSMRPARETHTTENTEDPDLPPTPQQPADLISGNMTMPATASSSSDARGHRRSPPPRTPFILDPLL